MVYYMFWAVDEAYINMSYCNQETHHITQFAKTSVPKYRILARPPNSDKKDSLKHDMTDTANVAQQETFIHSDVSLCKETSDSLQIHQLTDLIHPQFIQQTVLQNTASKPHETPSNDYSAVSENFVGSRLSNYNCNNGNGPFPDAIEVRTGLPSRMSKEKTPVTRLNEFTRFNKLSSQFLLVAEEGPPHNKTFYVQLTLGEEVYHGSASSMKRAQHDVAQKALEQTRYPHPPYKHQTNVTCVTARCPVTVKSSMLPEDSHSRLYLPQTQQLMNIPGPAVSNCVIDQNLEYSAAENRSESCQLLAAKSVINEVQELAVKIGLLVSYDIVQEISAPNSFYTMSCTCGNIATQGSGPNKKIAKKEAANSMLIELQNLVRISALGLSVEPNIKKRPLKPKERAKTIVKPPELVHDSGASVNHSGTLFQVQQARRGSTPVFTDIGVRGVDFITEVCVDDTTCTGVGRTKKLSRHDAAKKMLRALGFADLIQESPSDVATSALLPIKSALRKSSSGTSVGEKRVMFIEPDLTEESDGKSRRQRHRSKSPPLSDRSSETATSTATADDDGDYNRAPNAVASANASSCSKAAVGASWCRDGKVQILKRPSTAVVQSNEPAAVNTDVPVSKLPESSISAVDDASTPTSLLLRETAELNIGVKFDDLPTGAGNEEYMSFVTVSTNPPQINHGSGATVQLARDTAAQKALEMLREFCSMTLSDGVKSS